MISTGKDPVRSVSMAMVLVPLILLLAGSIFLVDNGECEDHIVSPWPMFGHDVFRTGQSSDYMGSNQGEVIWSLDVGPVQSSSPCISRYGTIYIGSRNYHLNAVTPEGKLLWDYECGGEIVSSPALDELGNVIFGCLDGYLYCLFPNGTLRWQTYLGDEIRSSPLLSDRGNIYIGTDEGRLFRISGSGIVDWFYQTDNHIWGSPAMLSDGRIVVPSMDQHLYCLYGNGTLSWKEGMGGSSLSTPLVLPDDRIVLGSHSESVYCFHGNGTPDWEYDTGGIVATSPSLGPDGYIYLGCDSGRVMKLQDNGGLIERYDTHDEIRSSALITGEGRIIIGTKGGTLYSFYNDLDVHLSRSLGYEISGSPVMDPNGVIYVATNNGKLYSIGTRRREPPSAPLNFTVTPQDEANLLMWEPPMNLGNLSLTGYEVYRRDPFTGEADLLITLLPSDTGLLDNSVVPGEEYTYWINAVNELGISPDTTPKSGIPLIVLHVPSPPRNVMISSTETKIILMWDTPFDRGGSNIEGYYVLRFLSTYELDMRYDVGLDQRYELDDLEHGRNYIFAVTAYNQDGESELSDYKIGRLKVDSGPDWDTDNDGITTTDSSDDNIMGVVCCFMIFGGSILLPIILLAKFGKKGKEEKVSIETGKVGRRTTINRPILHTVREGHRSGPVVKTFETARSVQETARKKTQTPKEKKIEDVSKPPKRPISTLKGMTDDMIVERILELSEMKDEGMIDEEEYSVMKQRLVRKMGQ